MSGIVGICHFDGAPVDQNLLKRMTDSLVFRGPDATEVWIKGHVGFGHTLLKSTDEAEHEHQPFTLDGAVWIVADARVDARRELIAKLETQRQTVATDAPDVELLLRAYVAWGEDCVEHLLGDFAFGIWDGPRQRLFCARDHMGVKPFYYAQSGECVVFSNTLDCVRMHPAVSDRLNELAIADYLLFEHNHDSATTSFADIQRIPPAHCVSWSRDGRHLRRYWTLPVEEPLFYRHLDDYTSHFRSLARTVVSDRLRTDRVGIFMSGGLDSTTLAATAAPLLRERGASAELRAFTGLTEYAVIADEERCCAELTAERVGIPIEFMGTAETDTPLRETGRPLRTPEPVDLPPWLTMELEPDPRFSSFSRVFLYGEGPDNALTYEWQPYFSDLLRRKRFGQLIRSLWWHTSLHRRFPLPFAFLKGMLSKQASQEEGPIFPEWLNPELQSRLQLRERWRLIYGDQGIAHPVRPRGYASLHIPLWQQMFESQDPGRTGSPYEIRQPFADVRMLQFLLRVPAVPWCRSKYLIRRAMRGVLPDRVLDGPKRGIPCNFEQEGQVRPVPSTLLPARDFGMFVNYSELQARVVMDPWQSGNELRARSLNHWLQNSRADRIGQH